jgi:hypothetical protein
VSGLPIDLDYDDRANARREQLLAVCHLRRGLEQGAA